jgi:hypothetical protein
MVSLDFDQVARHFARAIDERDLTAPTAGVWIVSDRFRRSPQGRALLQRMNLTNPE